MGLINKVVKLRSLLIVMCVGIDLAFAVSLPKFSESVNSNKKIANVKSRFIVLGNAKMADCVLDQLTGLMWPRNASIGFMEIVGEELSDQPDYTNNRTSLNQMSLYNTLIAIKNMNHSVNKLCGYSDWRLPSKDELKSILGRGVLPNSQIDNKTYFLNIQVYGYWSSTGYTSDANNAWYVNGDGRADLGIKTGNLNVWPVRNYSPQH